MMNIAAKLGFTHIEWRDDHLVVLDQRKLPLIEEYYHIMSVDDGVEAIRNMTVRGAPLLGVTAAYTLCLVENLDDSYTFSAGCDALKSARPTAVNLSREVDRMARIFKESFGDENISQILLNEAIAIHREDSEMCRQIGILGNKIIPDKCRILTHCNTGALATGGIGTALGVIYTAHFSGKKVKVWVDETRPVLQGARLNAWELSKAGIEYSLIVDNASGTLMAGGEVDLVIVGADRVARNLDFANKIGTYNLAVLAKYHDIPFYCAAPTSTFDPACPDGNSIIIEKRDPDEVRNVHGAQIAPPEASVYNPAFDITPHEFLTGLITEKGILVPEIR